MASVEMGAEGSYRFKGEHITQVVYCLYCDKCGSFSIGKRPTLKMLIGISVAAITATVIWNSMKEGALPGAWLACFGPLFIFLSLTGVLKLGDICRKCGNMAITLGNAKNYPRNDRSILDVPYETTVRYYVDDY